MLLAAPPPAVMQAAFVFLVIGLTALDDATSMRRLRQFTSSAARLSAFRRSIGCLCAFALLATALAYPADLWVVRPAPADIAWLHRPLVHTLAVVVLAIYLCLALVPAIHCAIDPRSRRTYWEQTRPLHFLLPVSASERRWWALLSVAAGVCEEVVFRGFLMQFLQGRLHGEWQLDVAAAWLLSALLFGCCHCYQGAAGIARTTLGGVMFGLLALVSGSLLLPIVLHALVDLAVLWVYRPQLDDPEAAARLVQGCAPTPASAGS